MTSLVVHGSRIMRDARTSASTESCPHTHIDQEPLPWRRDSLPSPRSARLQAWHRPSRRTSRCSAPSTWPALGRQRRRQAIPGDTRRPGCQPSRVSRHRTPGRRFGCQLQSARRDGLSLGAPRQRTLVFDCAGARLGVCQALCHARCRTAEMSDAMPKRPVDESGSPIAGQTRQRRKSALVAARSASVQRTGVISPQQASAIRARCAAWIGCGANPSSSR